MSIATNPADLIRDARKGRTDEQALVFLAEMVLVLRHGAKLDALEHEICNLINRIEQLRDALAFYADRETWRGDPCPAHSDVDGDFRATPGKRARAALKETER